MFGNFGEDLTLTRPAPPDRNGDPTGDGASTVIPKCPVWPRGSSSEQTFSQDTVIVGYTALLPVGTDVLPTDRISWSAGLFEIEGEPGRFHSPLTGSSPGIVVALRRVTG